MSKLRRYGFIPGLIICVGLTAFYSCNWYVEARLHQAVRVHFIANSNRPEDQHLKLQVRDQVLRSLHPGMTATSSRSEAIAYIQSHLSQLQLTADKEIEAQGYSYPVKVAISEQEYGWRTSGGVIFTPGAYTALTVTIGQGQGHNWWGVIYPPFGMVSEEKSKSGVELRCKILDVAREVKAQMQDH